MVPIKHKNQVFSVQGILNVIKIHKNTTNDINMINPKKLLMKLMKKGNLKEGYITKDLLEVTL